MLADHEAAARGLDRGSGFDRENKAPVMASELKRLGCW